MSKFKRFLKGITSLVNCPSCGQLKFKRIENLDGSFYWKCMHCLYQSNLNKKK